MDMFYRITEVWHKVLKYTQVNILGVYLYIFYH